MKEYFRKLVRNKYFWISIIGGLALMAGGAFYPQRTTFTDGQFSGMFLGIGFVVPSLIISNIVDNFTKYKKPKEK